MRQEGELTQNQKILNGVLFALGGFIGFLGLDGPIHEFGHVFFATIFADGGRITGFAMSVVRANTPFENYMATMGGVWFEAFIFIMMWRVLWKSPFRGLFAGLALFGCFSELFFKGYSYNMVRPDYEMVNGFWISLIVWWGLWFFVFLRKKSISRLIGPQKSPIITKNGRQMSAVVLKGRGRTSRTSSTR